MLDGKKIGVMLPISWKKSLNNGINIRVEKRRCGDCKGEILCLTCNNPVNENEEFEANLNLLKRYARNQFGHMVHYHKL